MKNPNEDQAYEQWKQRMIDTDPLWKSRLGSGVPHDLRIQKFSHHDPDPHVPFVDEKFPPMSRGEKIIWAALVGFWGTFIYFNPFGWTW